ncbi:pre-mRNA-splicing factor CWC25 [Cordyceps javanica]|uniref:Pre-mRNA-splicing factor CWC25 n=1 Tax=Cordyceps javanica TaxID=43265 RepID=A0A545V8L8_9HYPO|nr:pre-mRNA-splicing factor CWC25 [Cordyceps javanica]TQW08755.1 pre-mRNA-splicing factor CWC25 [Cordyceps javanica]
MGGGDLNLKKSFHPTLRRNQAAVYDEEQKALAERKRTQQRIDEIKEERAKEELQRQLEAAGGKKRVDRVDWMYQGPTDGQAGTTEEMEAYLLGKRRIDNLIKGNEHEKLEKNAGQESFMALQNANSARDTAAKIRDDPLLAIKRQEQAAYEAMMNDPMDIDDITAITGAIETEIEMAIAIAIAHTDPDVAHIPGLEAHTGATLTLAMMSEVPDGREMTLRNEAYDVTATSRNRSPEGDRPRYRDSYDKRGDRSQHRQNGDRRPNFTGGRRDGHHNGRQNSDEEDKRAREENARKLAAMQSAANELDQDRSDRLAAIEEKERLARDADDDARERNGDRAFTNGLHRQAGHMDLGARMGRNKHGYQRDDN